MAKTMVKMILPNGLFRRPQVLLSTKIGYSHGCNRPLGGTSIRFGMQGMYDIALDLLHMPCYVSNKFMSNRLD